MRNQSVRTPVVQSLGTEQGGTVRYHRCNPLAGPGLSLLLMLVLSVAGMREGVAGSTALVKGDVAESTCNVDMVGDDGKPTAIYDLQVEDQSVGALQSGGVYGLYPLTIELRDCYGVVYDANSKYTKTVGVIATGATTAPYLFRRQGGGTENDADPTYGFAITGTDPKGKSMNWTPGVLINDSQMLTASGSVVDLHNNSSTTTVKAIPFWIGVSCGDSTTCAAVQSAIGGSLRADIEFTFNYQ